MDRDELVKKLLEYPNLRVMIQTERFVSFPINLVSTFATGGNPKEVIVLTAVPLANKESV